MHKKVQCKIHQSYSQKVTLSLIIAGYFDDLSIPIIQVIAIITFNYLINGVSSACTVEKYISRFLSVAFQDFRILQFPPGFLCQPQND